MPTVTPFRINVSDAALSDLNARLATTVLPSTSGQAGWAEGPALSHVEGLLQRLFDGRVAPLVAHFSRQRKLSPNDVADLRKLLEELDDGKP